MITKRLISLREKAGISQVEISKRLGVARTTYASYEQGAREPDIEMLNKLATFHGVSVDFLLGNENKNNTNPLNNDQAKNDELMKIIARLPQDKKKIVIEVAKGFLDE
jgi:transcriptional regulator with XRE-family HTH domain